MTSDRLMSGLSLEVIISKAHHMSLSLLAPFPIYVDLPIKTKEWPECADRQYLFAVRFGNRHDEALNARPICEP